MLNFFVGNSESRKELPFIIRCYPWPIINVLPWTWSAYIWFGWFGFTSVYRSWSPTEKKKKNTRVVGKKWNIF